jgi:hypothetical protein
MLPSRSYYSRIHYSLWKATKKLKHVKKAHAFAEHLADVSQPHPSHNEPKVAALTHF